MRLFIAFEIPDDVSVLLSETQHNLNVPGKATFTKSFHLTLKFLGEVEESKLPDIKQALSKITFEPFKAKLTGIGAFPNKRDPRVVWVGLEPHEVINNVRNNVEQACTSIGFEPDTRFHPHLTLARIKFLKDKKQFQNHLENIKAPAGEFLLDSFHLIRSVLTPEGPKYEILEIFTEK